jgi:hypothetical protein
MPLFCALKFRKQPTDRPSGSMIMLLVLLMLVLRRLMIAMSHQLPLRMHAFRKTRIVIRPAGNLPFSCAAPLGGSEQ